MNGAAPAQTAAQLKKAFDESFSKASVTEHEVSEDLLAIRAAGNRLAVRACEIAGIMRCPPLTPLPSQNTALRGMAGIRGRLVAVYDIAALIGESQSAIKNSWIVLCAADRSAALLFDELVGYERVRSSEIHTAEPQEGVTLAKQVVQIGDLNCAVISIPTLLETIHRAMRTDADKE